MYGKGMSTRDITDHLYNIYGIEASPTFISGLTDKILPMIQEWQNRPLELVYPIVFMDAIHYKVRQDNRVVNKAAYAVIGVNMSGMKDVLGIWIGENETSKYWLKVLTELRNRGVSDILIASVDGLNGFSEAIKAVFPRAEIQRCIIHQIRNSSKYVSYKDLKEFNKDLKVVYTAVNEHAALAELDRFEEKWGSKYSIAIRSWRNNWSELSTFFKYPEEIRRIIYTTNAMESYNRQLRKVTKSKSIFPSDESLNKMLYLATVDITKKWTQSIRGWSLILAQLCIYFEDRVNTAIL
jgi:transposase-like protein